MKTWFLSDPHFGHKRIIELCERPFESVEDMNEVMLDNINSTPGIDHGRLVITGDILMGVMDDSLTILGQIHCAELVLLPGNHDRWSLAWKHNKKDPRAAAAKRSEWAKRYFEAGPEWARTRVFVDQEPSYWPMSKVLEDDAKGHPLAETLISHYPYKGDSQYEGDDRYDWLRAPDDGLPIIHGHVHNEWRAKERMFNVGVDVNGFKPVSEEEIVSWMEITL